MLVHRETLFFPSKYKIYECYLQFIPYLTTALGHWGVVDVGNFLVCGIPGLRRVFLTRLQVVLGVVVLDNPFPEL